MFFFSVPLMFSQILEVMFNLSDVAVVGHFADYKALGSVGSTTTLVTLFTGLLIGLGSGVNVQVANKLGAGNEKATKEAIHSALIICAAAGIFVCLICLLFAGPMLSMINTKPELLDQAVLYMKVFALGMPATAIYNFGNGVLSARGDTKRPMYYLAFAGILNVILNLIFVIVFHMAAVGVATASAIAQYVSGGLILIHLMRRDDDVPRVDLDTRVMDAMLELSRTGLGLVAVCDAQNRVQGVFTDGDLRRVFDTGVDMRNASIADVMTPGGIRIRPGILAVDALNLMQSRHITCVLVADGDRLLGVVHMHDLLRAGVV